ncbi:MAG: PAS domain S-box protein [Nitrosomonadales bacterium]|nr:PAS domain S-box protein [Nitrosomonadales bacterium]
MQEAGITANLRILMLEDAPTDAELAEYELRKAGFSYVLKRVETRNEFVQALRTFRPDIVLSDYKLPDFDGMSALQLVQQDFPETPVIMVTGALSDVSAVELIHAGAKDYVLKDRLARLAPAVQRALSVAQEARARKQAEQALKDSEAKFRALVESSSDWIWEIDAQAVYTYSSPQVRELLGYAPEEIVGKTPFDLMMVDAAPQMRAIFGAIVAERRPFRLLENANLHKDGRTIFLETCGVPFVDAAGNFRGFRGIDRDITERKQAEQALKDSATRYTAITENANDAIICLRPDDTIELWNKMAQQMFGFSAEEAIGKPLHDLIVPERYRALAAAGMCEFRQNGTGYVLGKMIELTAMRRDGTEFPVELSISAMSIGGEWRATGIVRDISERRQDEEALLRLNRTLRALSAGNHALVHGEDEKRLLESMCQATTEGGYSLAWVGYAVDDERKSVVPMAVSGVARGYVEGLDIVWADQPLGGGPTGAAVRTGQTQIAYDIKNDPRMTPWREAASRYGFASSIALPLKDNGKVFGVLTIYAAEPEAFGADQIALLEEMAGDLTFGIVNLRTRKERDEAVKERQHYVERLRASLEDALQAIAATVEMRDPYTAGHQRRMAGLAAAIARDLGLPEEQVHGIHLAGIVHDLGKINVPAEILSKPGVLSGIEYSLIKIHPQAGYEILKGIEFPWPIAQAVLQHHERLDGSGYPQGLKDEQILLEAKILAVADVVEAMSSHRPYRAGLGLERALAEIAGQRGVLYDPAVVDCCLALFREKHYTFPSEAQRESFSPQGK